MLIISAMASLSVAKRHGLIEAELLHWAHEACTFRLSVAKRHGLIEAILWRAEIVCAKQLSVAKRHGLIEAMRSNHPTSLDIWLSVAKRHGLIEAATPVTINALREAVIRGKTPRPH